jgi:hypothetical protein
MHRGPAEPVAWTVGPGPIIGNSGQILAGGTDPARRNLEPICP